MDGKLWRGRRVLLTGHTGFKGSWLCKWLDMMGAEVLGISLAPDGFSPFGQMTFSSRFRGIHTDISIAGNFAEAVRAFRPEVVFHLAAQALVGRAYDHPAETIQANVMGTVRLLEALRGSSGPCAVVVVTSDKVYENLEKGRPFIENDRLGGSEPYSVSKVCQEWVTRAYAASYFTEQGIRTATARGSNVYGGGDYHYDRLIPGLIDNVLRGTPHALRSPGAVRPWQYVLCLLEGYLTLAEKLLTHPVAAVEGWNFGPDPKDCITVAQVAHLLSGAVVPGDTPSYREAQLLCLDAGKSKEQLNWRVRIPLEEGLTRTLQFYRRERAGEPTDALMREELEWYVHTCEKEM